MSGNILYYSNYCDNCKKMLQILSRTKLKDEIHFLCIDRRIKAADGSIKLQIKNGQEVLLPPSVTKVPALLLVNNGFHVLVGDEIYQHLQPKESMDQRNEIESSSNRLNNSEPNAFSFDSFSAGGITSDQYSFLDINSDDMLAKGEGGLRQMHNYVNYNEDTIMDIATPPDNYIPDKVNEGAMNEYQQQRNIIK